MNTIIIIILLLIFIIFSIYLSIIIKIKINITYNEAAIKASISVFGIVKNINLKFNYINVIEKISKKHFKYIKNDKRKYGKTKMSAINKIRQLSLYKPFYIKNISFYSECYDNKLSVAVEFSIVNILLKRGILSE